MSFRAVVISSYLRLFSSAAPTYNFTTCACTNATLVNTTFVSVANGEGCGLNLDEVKIYGKFGQQLPIIVHSWSQCLAGNCGNYGPQHTVDGQIWNAAYLSSGTNQMVLAGGGPSFVT